jgi:GcrA cell cycle regulator
MIGDRMPFSAQDDARLVELWVEGLSIAQIGVKMGRTKNSVVGRVHRLSLPSRPSPIPAGGEPRAKKAQVLPLPREGAGLPGRRGSAAMAGPSLVLLGAAPAPQAAPPPPVRLDARHGCSWPFGEPRTKDFRYCDAPSVAGRSYCPAHCAQAYVRVARERTPAEMAADEARRAAAHGRMSRGGGTTIPMGADWGFVPRWAR